VHRRDEFRGEKYISDQVRANEKIELVLNAVVTKILGDDKVTSVEIAKKSGESFELLTDGVFVAIGTVPETGFLKNEVEMDGAGHIRASEDAKTSIEGVFAAGDVRAKSLRQIITACADGAVAAYECGKYLSEGK
jgi:thioredoxin reductase (NADPH)